MANLFDINPQSMQFRRVLPNGVAFVGMINNHIIFNFLRERPSDLQLPSLWQEAKQVVTERVPLDLYMFDKLENTDSA